MLSTIKRKECLSELLTKYPSLIEIYSDVDYSMSHDIVCFTLLYRGSLDTVSLFRGIQELYDGKATLYVTRNPYDIILSGLKIIWRKGEWHL